jgi:PAS domain S-box-containing protein
MRLLIVDDDVSVRRLVAGRLERRGVSVTTVATAATARTALEHDAFDVAIIDLNLPDGSGLDLVQGLRAVGSLTHVIILSGAGSETDRVRGLEVGADDYVVKPFFVREVVARVLAVRRRQDVGKDSTLRHGGIAIDLAARQVSVNDDPLTLTAKEFDLLAFLAARPGHVFSRDELLRAVWQSAGEWQQESTVTEHVRRLRSKIEHDPTHPQILQTVRGVGYRFDPPPIDQAEQPAAISPNGSTADRGGTIVHVDGRIVSADEAAVTMFGVTNDAALVGRDLHELIAPQSLTAANARERADASGRPPGSQVVALRRPDGSDHYVEVSSSRSSWNGNPARRVTVRPSIDPTARLRHLVTGIFSEVSDAVIVTDPNFHVRSWNQAAERLYGWAEREVLGRHLFDIVPVVDGGNEFSAALRTLEEKGRWFGEGHQVARDGSLVNVSASTTLLRDESGEPVVFVSVNRLAPPPATAARTRFPSGEDVADIRRGLDNDEFDVHYQPVVALDDLHVTTVEALVRWNHPERGLLTPACFIENAERSGAILELGRFVFDKACRQTAEWRRAGRDLGVAVNLSTKQLADTALLDDITATLTASGLDPHALWLEVTETALVEDFDQAADLLRRLAALGVGITIDDFGTGWASLTYLKQFPVHALKIDQSFVSGIDHNPQDAAIVRSILSLGEELDMIVVAEGVETLAQRSALQSLGCTIGQGVLFGMPTLAAALAVERAHRL